MMNADSREFRGQLESSSRGALSSVHDSLTSVRSLFSSKRIQPENVDVVYGIEELDTPIYPVNVQKPTKQRLPISNDEFETVHSQRCLTKFGDIMRKAWSTRYTEDFADDPEMRLKTSLRELFTYIIFLALLLIISFGTTTSTYYYFTKSLIDNIENNKFEDGSGTFSTISSMDDFWKYVESPLLESLFWDTWYNQLSNASTDDFIYYDDKLVGVPRLRQLRVQSNRCTIPSSFTKVINDCYVTYSDSDSDHTSFGLANDTAWIFNHSKDNSEYSYSGQIGSYESGGFMQSLTRDKASSRAIIDYLKQNQWITRNTRAVFIDYTIYNSNIDLYCVIKLAIEFPSTGGAFSKAELRTLKLLRYVTSYDYFVLCCELFVIIFLIYYIIEEILEIKKTRIRYFFEFWNVIDIFVIMISVSCVGLNIYRCLLANSKVNSLLSAQDEYADFDFGSYWQKIYNEAICINIFLSWVKIFKYIRFSKTLSQLSDTISRSMKDITGFTVMFVIVFLAYSQYAYFLFCSQVKDYRQFTHAIFALFRIILGDFNFNDMYKANNILGPLFFITYIFFVFFILLSMFIAIINDSYIEVKEKISKMKDEYNIASFFKNQILRGLRKDKVLKIHEILEKGNLMNVEELSYHDLRKELLQHGYAELEIQALFMKYDQDGDRVLDYDERNKMLQDIKERKMNVEQDFVAEDMEMEDDDFSVEKKEKEFVTQDQMFDLVDRINTVDAGLFGIIKKLDRVLECLEQSEKAKMEHQKNIRFSLEILTASRSNIEH